MGFSGEAPFSSTCLLGSLLFRNLAFAWPVWSVITALAKKIVMTRMKIFFIALLFKD